MNKNVNFFSKTMGIIHKDLLFCTSNSNEGGGQLGRLFATTGHALGGSVYVVCVWGGGEV